MNARTALVIGADGVLGSTVATAFAHAGWNVLRGTRRDRRTPDSVVVDLSRPETVSAALPMADLTVNTVPDINLTAETWALKHGGRVLNLATVPRPSIRSLRIRAAQQGGRGAVLLNAGLCPGVSNLAITALLAEYPESDTIEFVMCLPAAGMYGRAGVAFVHENLTTIGRHGVYSRQSPRHDTDKFDLPAPVGRKKCFGFAERERAWLMDTSGGRVIRTYAYLDRQSLHNMVVALNPLGLLSEVPKGPFLLGRHTTPAEPTRERIMHWASVKYRGERLAARTVECDGGYFRAAAAATIFGDAFMRTITETGLSGCFNPEELFTLNALREEFARTGITTDSHWEAPRPESPRPATVSVNEA